MLPETRLVGSTAGIGKGIEAAGQHLSIQGRSGDADLSTPLEASRVAGEGRGVYVGC